MTDNGIIKALECCSAALMYDEEQSLYKLALDLIKSQQAENENLKKVAESQQSLAMDRYFEIERLKKENDRLKADAQCADGYADALEERAKAEAIKEFAERLKDTKFKHGNDYMIYAENIDNLVKEMGGDKKMSFCWFIFEDGYRVCTLGFSKQELAVEERIHGKLISKEAE